MPVIVAHEHTWSFEGQPLRRFRDRELIARGVDAFIAVSREDQRRMIEIERIDPEDTIVHPERHPGAAARASGGDVRAELGIAADAPVIGTVGVLRPQKALDVLLRATQLLVERVPRPAGADRRGGRPPLRARGADATELGLEDTVMLLGVRTDVPDVLAALDVAVSSSDFEGSPLSVMEYMEAARRSSRPAWAACRT